MIGFAGCLRVDSRSGNTSLNSLPLSAYPFFFDTNILDAQPVGVRIGNMDKAVPGLNDTGIGILAVQVLVFLPAVIIPRLDMAHVRPTLPFILRKRHRDRIPDFRPYGFIGSVTETHIVEDHGNKTASQLDRLDRSIVVGQNRGDRGFPCVSIILGNTLIDPVRRSVSEKSGQSAIFQLYYRSMNPAPAFGNRIFMPAPPFVTGYLHDGEVVSRHRLIIDEAVIHGKDPRSVAQNSNGMAEKRPRCVEHSFRITPGVPGIVGGSASDYRGPLHRVVVQEIARVDF